MLKHPKTFRTPGLAALILVVTSTAYSKDGGGGGHAGNGIEFHKPSFAWFTGLKPLQVCLTIDPDFNYPNHKRISALVARAFERWNFYFQRKNLSRNFERLLETNLEVAKILKPIQNPTIALNCGASNSEIYSGQLSMVFGERDSNKKFFPNIQSVRREMRAGLSYSRPTDVVYIRSLSEADVPVELIQYPRVKPLEPRLGMPIHLNWNEDGLLLSVIIHEIGHILGIDHVDGTIMASNYLSPSDNNYRVSTSIDNTRELLLCLKCGIVKGYLDFSALNFDSGDFPYTAAVRIDLPESTRADASQSFDFEISTDTDSPRFLFGIKLESPERPAPGEYQLKASYQNELGKTIMAAGFRTESVSYRGKLFYKGQSRNITLSRNKGSLMSIDVEQPQSAPVDPLNYDSIYRSAFEALPNFGIRELLD